jgi:hypothetical protein
VLASSVDARVVTPTWRRDGGAVIAAVSRAGETFNLVEFAIDGSSARQLTDLTGGATWPDVSPDGRTIVFVGYTHEGYDLYTIPYSRSAGLEARGSSLAETPVPDAPSPQPPASSLDLPASSPYSPWATLRPTSWFPLLEAGSEQVRVGAGASGYDVLGYHRVNAAATWLVSRPSASAALSAPRADWRLSYAYSRWRPLLWVGASSETSFFGGPPTDAGEPSHFVERSRVLEAGVALPIVRTRRAQTATASVLHEVAELRGPSGIRTRDRAALRGTWAASTAHTFGYSISRETGVVAGVTAELVRRGLGAFADATTLTADVRAFLPGAAAHHVAALRIAGGASTGHADLRRTFLLGGSGPDAAVADFGSSAISLLRGFDANRFAGTRVALMNADYRLPLAWPQRGVGTWPLFLRAVHAAVFADAGHAWTRAFRLADLKTAFGLELSTDLVAGHHVPLTATIGAAVGRDGAGSGRGTIAYFRIGRAF